LLCIPPKIVLLKYCQPAVLKSRSLRLETMCGNLRGGLKKKRREIKGVNGDYFRRCFS